MTLVSSDSEYKRLTRNIRSLSFFYYLFRSFFMSVSLLFTVLVTLVEEEGRRHRSQDEGCEIYNKLN